MLRCGALALLLCGCEPASIALWGIDSVSQAANGRTVQGNLLYAATGKECTLLGPLFGKPMCSTSTGSEAVPGPPAYCYRTLGQVACHSAPDPWMPPATHLPVANAAPTAADR